MISLSRPEFDKLSQRERDRFIGFLPTKTGMNCYLPHDSQMHADALANFSKDFMSGKDAHAESGIEMDIEMLGLTEKLENDEKLKVSELNVVVKWIIKNLKK